MAKKPGKRKASRASIEKRIAKRKKALQPGEEGTETSADTNLVNAMETDPKFFKDPLIGTAIGKCKIEKYIGEGRTSVVYRAMYEPLRRTVALKVLTQSAAKFPAVVKVFQKEGRAVAALDHENILKIYDVGDDGPHHYLVLELLKGKELLWHIDAAEGGMPVESALDIVRQAATGLAAAHRKKLVHRDIKPQNLVVEPNGKVKIVDFGLAAEAEGAFSGGRLGTPHYMAPEVCRGEAARTASDVYSLGITLFHMLVGKPPYSGRKHTEEIIRDHLEGRRLEPEKTRKDIPRQVGDLIRRMTKQDAGARPTAREVRDFIEQSLAPGKLGGRGKAAGRKAVRRARKKEAPVALIALAGVIVIGIGGLLTVLSGSDDDNGADPSTPTPTPTATGRTDVVEPEPKPDDKPKVAIAKSLEQQITDLIAEARGEEKTENLREAHALWMRVLSKAPPESAYYREAAAAAKALKEVLERGSIKQPGRRRYIPVRESEEAGRQFVEGTEERIARLATFRLDEVKAELDDLQKRTRDASPERAAVDTALRRLAHLRSLLSIIETRAPSLPADFRQWMNFDIDADPELIVLGATQEGIQLKDEATGSVLTKQWSGLDPKTRIDFIEQIRSKANGLETMWLAYYCLLVGDARADIYFDYAENLDSSPETLREISELKASLG